MDVIAPISLYSVLMLVGLATVSGAMVLLTIWLSDNSEEPEAH